MGNRYDSEPGSGELTIDTGDKSGSIDATLTDSATGETVAVKGSWTCESGQIARRTTRTWWAAPNGVARFGVPAQSPPASRWRSATETYSATPTARAGSSKTTLSEWFCG